MIDCGEVPLTAYGSDGPVFESVCPRCRRFLKMPPTCAYHVWWLSEQVKAFWTDGKKPQCKRCGPVEPEHIGWAGD